MRKNYLLFVLVLATMFSAKTYAQVWEPVGNPEGITEGSGGYPYISVDNNNNYYVSIGSGAVLIYDFDNDSWGALGNLDNPTSIVEGANTFATSVASSVTEDGTFYYVFRYAGPNWAYPATGIMYKNNQWSQLPSFSEASVAYQTLAVTDDNKLIVFNNEGNGLVQIFDGESWRQIGDKGFPGGTIVYPNLKIDSEGNLYAAVVRGSNLRVFKNHIDGTEEDAWVPVSADEDMNVKTGVAGSERYTMTMVIDPDDNIFVQYVSNANKKLNVIKYDGTSWEQLGDEDFSPGRVQHTAMTLDAFGSPCIVASNWEDENWLQNYVMKYNPDENTWGRLGEGFISDGQSKLYNSIVLDRRGNLFVAYADDAWENKLMVRMIDMEKPGAAEVLVSTEDDVPFEITEDDGTLQLLAEVLPAMANQEIVWSIVEGANKAVVTKTGLVIAITSNGTVKVKATSAENSSIYTEVDVEITNQISDVMPEQVTISFEEGVRFTDIMNIGETMQLYASATPATADQYVTWSVAEGGEFASVDEDGLVTGLAQGVARVQATMGNKNAVVVISVFENGVNQQTNWDYSSTGIDIANARQADDFIVEDGKVFTLNKVWIRVNRAYYNSTAFVTTVDLNFFMDYNGAPGREIISVKGIVPASQRETDSSILVELILPEAIDFTAGGYWMNPMVTATDGSSLYWPTTTNTIGSGWHIGVGEDGWEIPTSVGEPIISDMLFNLVGNTRDLVKEVRINTVVFDNNRYTPVKQFEGKNAITVQVENKGKYTEKPAIIIDRDGFEVANQTIEIDANEIQDVAVTVVLEDLEIGDLRFGYSVHLNGDENLFNNTFSTFTQLSDSTFVADYLDALPIPEALGYNSGQMSIGNIFTLTKEADMTSVDVLFLHNAEVADQSNDDVAITVHKVNAEYVIDETPVVYYEFKRGAGNEFMTIMLPEAVTIEPGRYFFAVRQLSTVSNMRIAVDCAGGACYWAAGDALQLGGSPNYAYGSPHVRPNFGEVGGDVGINDVQIVGEVSVFPNPVVDVLSVTSEYGIKKVSIFDVTGAQVYSTSLMNTNEHKINVDGYASGVYFLKVVSNGNESTHKFIKK